jgi:hypothetical protein
VPDWSRISEYARTVLPDVDAWCERHLGSAVVEVLFASGHLSRVVAVRLRDGRAVTLKARPDSPRLTACTAVQRALWRSGFPAPEPILGPIVDRGVAVSAESYVPGGSLSPASDRARRFAELLARFVTLAPNPDAVGSFEPAPPWTAWGHDRPGIWPEADDRAENLNEYATPWLDEVGSRVRARLAQFASAGHQSVVGHGDWEAQNLRWVDNEALVVHDWDSVICAPEAIIVGLAASVWPCGIEPRAATVAESASFIDEYQRARGRVWSVDEVEASWAAGLWVYAFNAKKASLDGATWLLPDEAEARLRLAAA